MSKEAPIIGNSLRCCGLLLLCASAAHAGGNGPHSARISAADSGAGGPVAARETEQRMRQDMQSTLSRLAESGALGQHPEQISMRLEEPARRITSLGALVDSTSARSAQDGLHVLGATPSSTADRLGLHPGDVIVAVNGTSLRNLGADEHGRALAAATMKTVVDDLPDAATINVDVMRGGSALTLTAAVQSVYVPAMRVELGGEASGGGGSAASDPPPSGETGGCGRISAFDVAPRGEHLYAVRILLIDGTTPGPEGTPSFRVGAGEHHLLVAENIPTPALGIGEIATLRRQTRKPLSVIVQPGKTALVAAQLHLGHTTDLAHGSYWDPVVWKQIDESCR
jgi:hypothetical protein